MHDDDEKQGFPGQTEKGREEEVMSEAFERSWETNMKILIGNEIGHQNRIAALAEISLADAISLSRKTNDAYLTMAKQQGDAYMEQNNSQNKEALGYLQTLRKNYLENNRFTLDRLYGMFPEEAAGTSTLMKIVIEALKATGWTAPTS